MKKVININFQGTIVPIEESSYELLQQYIESLRRYFANEEGRDEIINDIESRISELFQERLKGGSTCITDEDVNVIINNMGRPQDFEEAEKGSAESAENKKAENDYQYSWNWKGKRLYRDENNKILGGVCSGIAAYFGIDPVIVRILFVLFMISGVGLLAYVILWIFIPGSNMLENGVRKRLYRNPENKIIAGVCSGIGSYFDVNPWLPRFIFLIPFITFFFRWSNWGPWTFPHFISFTFSPGSFLIYVILWLVIPEATTTTEKLEMKGEKIDLNSIKNSVLKEMQEVGQRVGKMGKDVGERMGKMGMEAGQAAREKGAEIGKDIHYAAHRSSGALGNIITTIFKIFMYFILGCIALAVIIALFTIATVAIGIFPLKNFVLTNGWQNIFAWGTLIFFIAVPVIGIITFIIRRLARIKKSNKLMRWSFLGLWIIGVICFFGLLSTVASDFRSISSLNTEKISLTDPHVKSLEIVPLHDNNYNRYNSWFRLEPFADFGVDEDTAYIPNVGIRITKSASDSFEVSQVRFCNGSTRRNADSLASLMNFNIQQNDSLLMVDRSIPINTTDKFRNQYVQVTVAVPVGHYIKISQNFERGNRVHFQAFWNNNYYNDDTYKHYPYTNGVLYVMKEDGLYTLDGRRSDYNDDEWNSDTNNDQNRVNDNGSYRYNENIDSLKKKLQDSEDSLKALHEDELKKMKDSLQKEKESIDKKLEKLDKKTASYQDKSETLPVDNYSFIIYI
jgi:phage shock protein PspC (stress-responsive transcriptional regulator)